MQRQAHTHMHAQTSALSTIASLQSWCIAFEWSCTFVLLVCACECVGQIQRLIHVQPASSPAQHAPSHLEGRREQTSHTERLIKGLRTDLWRPFERTSAVTQVDTLIRALAQTHTVKSQKHACILTNKQTNTHTHAQIDRGAQNFKQTLVLNPKSKRW